MLTELARHASRCLLAKVTIALRAPRFLNLVNNNCFIRYYPSFTTVHYKQKKLVSLLPVSRSYLRFKFF